METIKFVQYPSEPCSLIKWNVQRTNEFDQVHSDETDNDNANVMSSNSSKRSEIAICG